MSMQSEGNSTLGIINNIMLVYKLLNNYVGN